MRTLLALLLAGGALAAAGCSSPAPWVPPVPEAFTAVYEYQLSWGDRHGFANVTLSGPADVLGSDRQPHPAYVLTWDLPQLSGGDDGAFTRSPIEAALDGTLQAVRIRTCLPADDRPCDTKATMWPAIQHSTLFSYGLPATVPPGSPSRTDHADGSVDIDRLHYAPGRLVPDFIDLTSTAGPEWLRLVEYRAGPALPPIAAWPPAPQPLANATAAWRMFPGEDADLLGAGWTPLDALEALRQDPEAAAVLDGGGCVVDFTASHRPDGSPTSAAVRRDGASAGFMLQDRDGQSSRWSLYRNSGLTSLAQPGWTAPERDEGWPFPGERTCAELAAGPAPRLDARQAVEATEAFVPLDGRDLHFEASRQVAEHGGWSPRAFSLQFTVNASPVWETSVQLPTQPSVERHGYGHGAVIDAWAGTLQVIYTPGASSPP